MSNGLGGGGDVGEDTDGIAGVGGRGVSPTLGVGTPIPAETGTETLPGTIPGGVTTPVIAASGPERGLTSVTPLRS